MDTDSFIMHIKTEDIAIDVEKDFIHQIIKSIEDYP